MKIIFIAINGYQMPYSRIRCYHFANILNSYGIKTEVISYHDYMCSKYDPIQMLDMGDKDKLRVSFKVLPRLLKEKGNIFYIQKLHYHAALPFVLSRLGRNRFILDYDDYDFDRFFFFGRKYLNKLFFGETASEKITQKIASKAKACVVSSKYLYYYIKQFNKNVSYVPTGVDTEYFNLERTRPNSKITFVWTGQIWGELIYNNLIYIIDCFSKLQGCSCLVKMRIIGMGGFISKLKKYIYDNYSELDIEIIDWVHPTEMPKYLISADIGLLPLIPDSLNKHWMESKSPTKLFEYMAMKMPTVASSFGEVKYIIEDGKDGFLAKTKDEFVYKMKLLVEDEKLRRIMGEAARKKVEEKYSLHKLGKQIFDITQKVQRI